MASGSEPFQRKVLSRYAGVPPQDLKFTRGGNGKPALSSPHLPIAFNLSHSGDRMVLAISAGPAIGVDLEYCDPGRDILKLARRSFSNIELRALLNCEGLDRVYRFYDYWTLKEATVKAAGASLGLELESTCFELADLADQAGEPVPARITPVASALNESAWFALLQPFDGYRLALCCVASQDYAAGLLEYHWPKELPEAQSLRLLAVSSLDEKPAGIANI